MDFLKVESESDVRKLAHHLSIDKLAQFASVNRIFRSQSVGTRFNDLKLVNHGNQIWMIVDDTYEFPRYSPTHIFHDGPMLCEKLKIVGSCLVPPPSVSCRKLEIELSPYTIPLIHNRLVALTIFYSTSWWSRYLTLEQLMAMLGPRLEELRIPLRVFSDGQNFAEIICRFRSYWLCPKLRTLTIELSPFKDVMICIKKHINFFCRNNFINKLTFTLRGLHQLTNDDLADINDLLISYFIPVDEFEPSDRQILFRYRDEVYLNYVMPYDLETYNEDWCASDDIHGTMNEHINKEPRVHLKPARKRVIQTSPEPNHLPIKPMIIRNPIIEFLWIFYSFIGYVCDLIKFW